VEKYYFEFCDNNSKRWDGRQLVGEEEWLEGLYEPDELVVGKRIELPFPVKGSSSVKYWSAVIVYPNSAEPMKAGKAKPCLMQPISRPYPVL
jgi:hypothetical protein